MTQYSMQQHFQHHSTYPVHCSSDNGHMQMCDGGCHYLPWELCIYSAVINIFLLDNMQPFHGSLVFLYGVLFNVCNFKFVQV